MAYIVPRVLINQEFTQLPVFGDQPLSALVFGPQFNLYRYSVLTEKAYTRVQNKTTATLTNKYQKDVDTTYSFPNQENGTVVDTDYVKVFLEKAQVEYYGASALDLMQETGEVEPVPSVLKPSVNYPNYLKAEHLVFKAANSHLRSPSFSNRDVQVGDIVVLKNEADVTFSTKIKSLHASKTASVIAASTAGASNATTGGATQHPPTVGGTYNGPIDLTYVLTVMRGGAFLAGNNSNLSSCARVSITSSSIDGSPTVNVSQNGVFAVGSYGVTAKFETAVLAGGLVEGDIYLINCQAAHNDIVNIVETYDTLPASFINGADESWEISSLRMVKDYQLNQVISSDSVDLNYEIVDQAIKISSGITTTDPLVTIASVCVPLEVMSADIFVEHRDLVITNSISIGSLSSTDQVEAVLGTIHPDNALAQGVYDALLNSAGVVVYFCAVGSNDLAGYTQVLGLAKKSDLYYGLVPLTFNRAVQDAVVGHVNGESTAQLAKWRVTWLSSPIVNSALLYDTQANGSDWVATVIDDPVLAGTQYTYVNMAGASFITDGVRPTDKFLINFGTAADGSLVYEEYVIADVRTETSLALVSGPASAITVATKAQVKRVFTKDEQIDNLAAVGSGYNNRRVRMVFPDTTKDGEIVKPGYFVAAALAGLRSGVVPHQGLTNSEVLGFTDLRATVITYSEDQLNRLAAQGYFIVTQDVLGSTPYVRHQLTTDASSLNMAEDSVTTNVDSISYGLFRQLKPFIGIYNVHPKAVDVIRHIVDKELHYRLNNTFTARAGNQLTSYKIVTLAQNPTFKDHIDIELEIGVPYPINFITVKLFV